MQCDLVEATGAVYNIVGGPDMTLGEINAASDIIQYVPMYPSIPGPYPLKYTAGMRLEAVYDLSWFWVPFKSMPTDD